MIKLLNREMVDVKSRDTLLKEASGSVTSNDPMVGFLYDLMRDYVKPGDIERAVENNLYRDTCTFSNGWLAKYAEDIVKTLRNPVKKSIYEVGDVVQLRSGGPAMTVTSLDNFVGKLECTWFNVCESTYNYYTEDSLTLLTPKTSVQ